MARMGYGLKRRVFIYETLLELPVEIYAGPIVETLHFDERMRCGADCDRQNAQPAFEGDDG